MENMRISSKCDRASFRRTTLNQKHANSLDSENLAVSLYYFTCEKPGTCRQYNMDTEFKDL